VCEHTPRTPYSDVRMYVYICARTPKSNPNQHFSYSRAGLNLLYRRFSVEEGYRFSGKKTRSKWLHEVAMSSSLVAVGWLSVAVGGSCRWYLCCHICLVTAHFSSSEHPFQLRRSNLPLRCSSIAFLYAAAALLNVIGAFPIQRAVILVQRNCTVSGVVCIWGLVMTLPGIAWYGAI
jgi:hypothetical protein